MCEHSLEVKYLVRSLNPAVGLRIGLSNKSMEKILLEQIKDPALIEDFEKTVFGYMLQDKLIYNVPFKPMVGRPFKSAAEVLTHFSKRGPVDLVAEIKYDGERTQIHYENGEVNLFSRNFDSQNKKFWLLKERLELHFQKQKTQEFQLFKWQNINKFILDGEIVYVNEKGNFLEFQQIDRKQKENATMNMN